MSSQPPRIVPTLTEVVQPAGTPAPAANAATGTAVEAGKAGEAIDRARLEEQLVQRVVQRVDLVLERRLREAVGQLILEHTQRLVPQLREELESVVHQAVVDAFAQELENARKPVST